MNPKWDMYSTVDLEKTHTNLNVGNRKILPETDHEIIEAEGIDLEAEREDK